MVHMIGEMRKGGRIARAASQTCTKVTHMPTSKRVANAHTPP